MRLTVPLLVLGGLGVFLVAMNIRLFEENERVNKILRQTVDIQKASYKYLSIEETYQIQSNGNTECSKSYNVVALGHAPIHCLKVFLGAGPGTPPTRFSKLQFSAKNATGSAQLQHHLLSDEPRRKEVLVLFEQSATSSSPYQFQYSYVWPGLYNSLVRALRDDGASAFKSSVDNYKLVLKLPANLKADSFSTAPHAPASVSPDRIELVLQNLAPGAEYRFDVSCSRRS